MSDEIPEVYCPFAGDGECPSMPKCKSNKERICVNGEDDDE